MTTTKIVSLANNEGLASPDFPLEATLRWAIVPEFLEGVGNVGWRRRRAKLALPQNSRSVDLPEDFNNMEQLYREPYTEDCLVPYIGNDPAAAASAETNTTACGPCAYYLDYDSDVAGAEEYRKLMFPAPANQAYGLLAVYYLRVFFADDTTELNFNKYIPSQYQWGLVDGLKRDIFYDRYGIGDPRAQSMAQRFQADMTRAREGDFEQARDFVPRFII